jgi:positive regulator of sigma E activity
MKLRVPARLPNVRSRHRRRRTAPYQPGTRRIGDFFSEVGRELAGSSPSCGEGLQVVENANPGMPVEVELAGREAELSAKLRSDRFGAYGTFAAAVVAAAVGVQLNVQGASAWFKSGTWVICAFLLVVAIGFVVTNSERRVELQKIQTQRQVYRQLQTPNAKDEDYFRNLVTINVTNLSEYYYLVKTHTNASFRTALAFGVVGFMLVGTGIVLGYVGKKETIALAASIAGVLTEFISSIFFYLYNRTVRQLKEYHDSLLDVQDVLLALKVLESLQDPAAKSEVVKSVVLYLMKGDRKLRAAAASGEFERPTEPHPSSTAG